MTLPERDRDPSLARPLPATAPANLVDVLERILDKGIVIAGDIRINLLDIELLTVKLRLLVTSVDKARELGIDWWQGDPFLTRGAAGDTDALEQRLQRLEDAVGLPSGTDEGSPEAEQEETRERRDGGEPS